MTETTTGTTTRTSALKAAVVFCRVLQAAAGALAAIFVLGAILGGMRIVAFVVITVVAATLLLVVLVLEVVAIRGLRRWADGS